MDRRVQLHTFNKVKAPMHRNNNVVVVVCLFSEEIYVCNTLKQHCLPEVNTSFLFLHSYSKQLINQ